MLSVAEARDRILSRLRPVAAEVLGLIECADRVLAQDVSAPGDLPAFDNSAMDGFAVRAADTSQANGWPRLHVVADVPAGAPISHRLGEGEAARIMTGAPLPAGADAVIPVEDTDAGTIAAGTPAPAYVTLGRSVTPGEYVRPRGQDARKGEVLLREGARLRAQDLGILAMLGQSSVRVFKQPRVALISSGDELLEPGAPSAPGKIRESNSFMIGRLLEQSGAEALRLGIARDSEDSVQGLLNVAVAERVDLILSTAGVSVGALDYVRKVLSKDGELDFWKVNMRPGKPLVFGQFRGVPFLGLPGNPVSAFVAFEVFGRDAVGRLAGLAPTVRPRVRVRIENEVTSDGRESYLRAVVTQRDGEFVGNLTGHQGSGNLLSLVQANALLIIPAGVKCLPAGREVDTWMI